MWIRQRSKLTRINLLHRYITTSKGSCSKQSGKDGIPSNPGYIRNQNQPTAPSPSKPAAQHPSPPPSAASSSSTTSSTSSAATTLKDSQASPLGAPQLIGAAAALGAMYFGYVSFFGGQGSDGDQTPAATDSVVIVEMNDDRDAGDRSLTFTDGNIVPNESTSMGHEEEKIGFEEERKEESSLQQHAVSSSEAEDKEGEQKDGEESPSVDVVAPSDTTTLVDSHAVLGMIEDVFSKSGEEMLRQDTENVQAKKEADVQATQVAITSAIADSAAESVASDLLKAPKGVAAMTPHQLQMNRSETSPSPSDADDSNNNHVDDSKKIDQQQQLLREVFGIRPEILSASELIAAASKRSGASPDWQEYAYRHKQAEADANTLTSVLVTASEHVKQEIARAEEEAARAATAAQAERFRAVITDALKQAEQGHAMQMKLQAEKLANAHAEFTVRERADRQSKLDDLRMKLSALERALERRSDQARGSASVHRMAQGAFALQHALAKGQVLDGPVEYLNSTCINDPLVMAALQTLPRGVPVPTQLQLSREYAAAVQRVARELHALPAGHGGMVSVLVAKLSARLKIKEHEPLASAISAMPHFHSHIGSIDAALAKVEYELANGRLIQAANILEQAVEGTAAAFAVSDWIKMVKARAAAEQAVALIEAHAATATRALC